MAVKIIFILLGLFLSIFIVFKLKKLNCREYTLRRAKKYKEFKQVSKCAYEIYGDSYPYTYIYNPEKLQLMNKEKGLISFIAKKGTKVIGHVALNNHRNLKDICEMSTAFVDSNFRGEGILNKLSRKTLNKSTTFGFKVAYVEAVCTHIFSQKGAKKLGLNECAIMLNKVNNLKFKNLEEKKKERETLVRCYVYLQKPKEKKLFLGKKHREIIREIYKNLGVEVEFYNEYEKNKIYNLKSNINVEYLQGGSVVINITEAGADIYDMVIGKVKAILRKGINTILLTMRLNDASTTYVCDKFENSGFIFCGIEPRYLNEDLIIFQYITHNVNFENISLISNEGNKLLKYIKNEYYKDNERKEANEF